MNKKILGISAILATGLLSGCASSTIKDPDAFQKVSLKATDKMPSKAALSGAKPRVIVFTLDDRKFPGAGEEVSDKIIKELNATHNVEIVDRNLAKQLAQEIQLAETKGRTGYRGQDVADFVITGKITSAGAGIAFKQASTWKDKQGETHENPATCTTNGKLGFTLKISQMPSLNVIKTIDEEATASSTEDGHWWNSCPALSQGAANGIVFAAASTAVQKAHTELKNQFAPTGYVLERRTLEKANIFKTTLGVTGGGKQEQDVIFWRTVSETNPLTGAITTEQVKVAEGVISNHVADSYSFVIVKDGASADKIMLGDMVKVKYEDSFADRLTKSFN